MTWFEQLTGFRELSPANVRAKMSVAGDCLVSAANGKRIAFGRLETPSLSELRARVEPLDRLKGRLQLSEVVADVSKLHEDSANAGAMFQVASQFNLLEMSHPSVTPEAGVDCYENDHTQGPACAVSCGAGTIYRNYFVPVGDQVGQSKYLQIDCSKDLGQHLGNHDGRLWRMENGYIFPSRDGLAEITTTIRAADKSTRDAYRDRLRIGVQWNAAVTLAGASHRVSQAYCSALPVGYGRHPEVEWADFARLVLEAAYEATLCAAIVNASTGGSNRLFLTLLGGGVFGNHQPWITDAIYHAATKYKNCGLEVAIVSHGFSKSFVVDLISRFQMSG